MMLPQGRLVDAREMRQLAILCVSILLCGVRRRVVVLNETVVSLIWMFVGLRARILVAKMPVSCSCVEM